MPELLVNLFVRIQNLFLEDLTIAEFQSILSIHMSLYYLPASLSPEKLIDIQNILINFNTEKISGTLINCSYFGEVGAPHLAYLKPKNSDILAQIHKKLKTFFPEFKNVPDNVYPEFIPHMTFFKIKNQEKFLIKKIEVEKTIYEELDKIKDENVFGDIAIYKVNSFFHPEIQIQMNHH